MVQLLAGANINDVTPQKATALHLAATHDRASISSVLLGEHIHCDVLDDALNNGNDRHCSVDTDHFSDPCRAVIRMCISHVCVTR